MNFVFENVVVFQATSRSRSITPSEPKQLKLKRFLDNVTQADSDKLGLLCAKFFFGCNISFNTCESKYFRNFIKALRPAYSPPNQKKLFGPLLNAISEKIESRNKDLVHKIQLMVGRTLILISIM